jgi:hypothetical protein
MPPTLYTLGNLITPIDRGHFFVCERDMPLVRNKLTNVDVGWIASPMVAFPVSETELCDGHLITLVDV